MALKNKQLKAIELLVYSPYMTYQMIADEVGVHRDTFRRWREDPEFQMELNKAIKNRWKAAESLAVNTMINLVSEGNYQATKYVLDSLNYAPAQKIDANVNSEQTINIIIEDEDEEAGDSDA